MILPNDKTYKVQNQHNREDVTKAAIVGCGGNQTFWLDLSSQQKSDFNSGTKKPLKKTMAMDAVHPGETYDHCLSKSP